MKTTIVIPNYNGISYLEKCLISLQKCGKDTFHIIVVDNGSTDGCVELLKEKFAYVESIFLPENVGFAPAVNIGLENVKTEYALLLNNDIEVESDFVIQMEEALERHADAFSVSSKMLQMHDPDKLDGAGDLYCALGWAFALGKGKEQKNHYTKECKVFSACAGAAIYRMSMLREIGFFDENHFAYLEDVDLGYRARIYGYANYYTPKAVCYHAGSAFSGSRYNEFKVNLSSRNSIYLILKNMPLLQIVFNLPFLVIGYLIKTLFFIKKGMGKTYVKGLLKGIQLYFSKTGYSHKVVFKWSHFINYVRIQMELWWNLVRRFML